MKRIPTVAAFVAVMSFVAPYTAAHDYKCVSRSRITAILGLKYGEVVRGEGIGATSTVIYEFWLSDKGTWSLTGTSADGVTCLLHAGTDWGLVDAPAVNPALPPS